MERVHIGRGDEGVVIASSIAKLAGGCKDKLGREEEPG